MNTNKEENTYIGELEVVLIAGQTYVLVDNWNSRGNLFT